MKFAIWAAVSTKKQATPDKVSLDEQERQCRSVAVDKGWIESAGPYVVPGASRSFYVDLSLAEKEIPVLRDMLDDARNGKFDILVIYNYDRLGDLIDMVAMSLRMYGRQIYSISQPAEPQDPDHFDPYGADNEAIMRDVARIWQRQRITDLRRKWKIGMPARIEKGLPASRTPFGYRWTGKKSPPEVVPEEAALILQMKDMFLQGASSGSIADFMNSTGIKPRQGGRWKSVSVRYILANPFYAGLVSINQSTYIRDPRYKNQVKQVHLPRSKWKYGKGQHKSLWNEQTYRAILAEHERRNEMGRRFNVRYPLSGLLVCSVCGRKVHRSGGGTKYLVLVCRAGHVRRPYNQVLKEVGDKWREQIQERKNGSIKTKQTDVTQYQAAIEEFEKRRKRIQDGFEAGIYQQSEALQKIADVESQIEKLRAKIEEGERAAQLRDEFLKLPDLEHFPDYLEGKRRGNKTPSAAAQHRVLAAMCRRIIVSPNDIEVDWRY